MGRRDLAQVDRCVCDDHAASKPRDIPAHQKHGDVWRASLQSVANGDENGGHAVDGLSAPSVGDVRLHNGADEGRTEEAGSRLVS